VRVSSVCAAGSFNCWQSAERNTLLHFFAPLLFSCHVGWTAEERVVLFAHTATGDGQTRDAPTVLSKTWHRYYMGRVLSGGFR